MNIKVTRSISIMFTMVLMSISLTARAGVENMKQMPLIQATKSYTVPSNEAGEELVQKRGYGDQEPMVKMMNLMMVEGSGIEGMSMDSMPMARNDEAAPKTAAKNPGKVPTEMRGSLDSMDIQTNIALSDAKVGSNTVVIKISDAKSKRPAVGLKLKAQVTMASMDMGVEEPKIKEVAPGKYQLNAVFTMKGPWLLKLQTGDGSERVLKYEAGK
jgi:hypothetical protein